MQFKLPLTAEVLSWEQQLQLIQLTVAEWRRLQRGWIELEPLFSAAAAAAAAATPEEGGAGAGVQQEAAVFKVNQGLILSRPPLHNSPFIN